MAADVNIVIASEFVGAKAFKDAEKVTTGLSKSVSTLAKSYVGLYSVQRLSRSGFNAVRAFADAEKASIRLSKSVSNLGLSFATADIQTNLDQISAKFGLAGEPLAEAFQKLLTTTGSVIKSQQLLNQALDISYGTGVELGTVTQDLANAYVGNVRGLRKYNLGLAQTELQTKSFLQITELLNEQFGGSGADYLDTYSGKMAVLAEAAGNAQEIIGKGLVDAFAKLGGGSTTEDAVNNITSIANGISKIVNAAATAIGLVVKLGKGIEYLTTFGGVTGSNGKIAQYTKVVEDRLRQFDNPRSKSPAGTALRAKQSKQAEEAANKRAKELAALQKKQIAGQKALTEAQKKQLALQKAGTLFDIEQTQIIAALKGDISAEERKRLELQLAILTGNTNEASKLAGELAKSQGLSQQLAAYLASLPDAKNPFTAWKSYLDMIEAQVRRISTASPSAPVTSMATGYGVTGEQYSLPNGSQQTSAAGVDFTVNVNAGSIIAQEQLQDVLRDTLLDASLSAKFSAIFRQGGSFGP